VTSDERTLPAGALLALTGLVVGIVAVTLPELGSDPWPFRPPHVDPRGVLAPLVRAAGNEWDVGIARSAAFLAALLAALIAALAVRRRAWPRWLGWGLALVVALALLVPSTLLAVGLRHSTAPWFFTNDSTYQIELAGDLARHGHNPYGHDYRFSGLERFYTYNGTASARVREREVALRHLAYFPGAVISAALWSFLPKPLDDYRLLVLLCTLATFGAAMLFRAPFQWRLLLGTVLVANPIAVRSAWFGQNDAPSLFFLVLSFALVTRGRHRWAAASLAAAVLLKQFAVVAVPFMALILVKKGLERRELRLAAAVFAGMLVVASLPFLIADPGAFWDDTVKYGAGTYKIVGYGLSAMLLRLGVLEDREGSYPFLLFAALLWLPLTVYLLREQWLRRELWLGALGFSVSVLVLLFVGRTFNNYYLIWPMTGAVITTLLAASEPASATDSRSPPAPPGSR
jgi:4-amino-4-deoxy-L-arabinose transferase-like glycosyltransferase